MARVFARLFPGKRRFVRDVIAMDSAGGYPSGPYATARTVLVDVRLPPPLRALAPAILDAVRTSWGGRTHDPSTSR